MAERVLMFEKSPSAFGVEPAQVRGVPQRREPQLTGTVITPWRSSLQDLGSRSQVTSEPWFISAGLLVIMWNMKNSNLTHHECIH